MTAHSKENNTSPEWQKYYEDLEKHKEFYRSYQFYLDRILRHLEFTRPSNTWTSEDIRKVISSEIDMALSCDAPNKPGYYRANND
jgi:hypothetical protein